MLESFRAPWHIEKKLFKKVQEIEGFPPDRIGLTLFGTILEK